MEDCSYTLIADIGKDVTLRRVTEGVYDPSTATLATSNSEETVKAMILSYRNSQLDGTQVRQGDRRIVIAARDVAKPSIDDLVISGFETYRLVSIAEVEENDTNLVYICQGRSQ